MIEIVETPIDIGQVLASVKDPAAGGIDLFIGTTRNNSRGRQVLYLEYETYQTMALKLMYRIADEAEKRWDLKKISVVHRIGRVDIGEASVVIATSAAHRKEAFEACRYAIDALKKDVPIWKKEHFEDGEIWVGPQT